LNQDEQPDCTLKSSDVGRAGPAAGEPGRNAFGESLSRIPKEGHEPGGRFEQSNIAHGEDCANEEHIDLAEQREGSIDDEEAAGITKEATGVLASGPSARPDRRGTDMPCEEEKS